MADVPVGLKGVWSSGEHIGPNKPMQYIEYRQGRLKHRYEQWNGPPVSGYVAGGMVDDVGTSLFWQKFWTPYEGETGEYTELPNVLQVELSQDFDNNGIQIATIEVENIAYPEVTGPNGTYHQIKRGYYAPYRGVVTGPPLFDEAGNVVTANSWVRRLGSDGQIRIWQGYGELIVPTFVGLVDDVDLTSDPTKITITARDFGQTLTDMRVFGWNKEPRIKIPVTFIDSLRADSVTKRGYDTSASSSVDDGHNANNVLNSDSDSFWQSEGHDGPDYTEWVQIHLPEGRYLDFYEYPRYRGMDMYVSLWVTNPSSGPATRDGEPIPEGWVDTGHGDVPGANGGIPYLKLREGVDARGQYVNIDGAVYVVGQGSRLRLSFRNLHLESDGQYYAGMNRFFANRRTLSEDSPVVRKHWILIDDVADMVKWALRWAGFKDWDVESTGVRLKDKMLFTDKDFLIDIIRKAQDLTGYVFFIKEPVGNDSDDDLGVPCFRRPVVVDQFVQPRALIADTNNLTGIQTKDTDEPRAYIIRARGRTASEEEGGERLDGDRVRRLMYVYKPPWWRRLGGIVKHVVQSDSAFKTLDDCKFACYYIALQEALEAEKASVECPGYPGFELDTHAAIADVGTAMAQRLWIAQRQSIFRQAEQSTYTMTLQGALVDTLDIKTITNLIRTTPRGSEN